MHVIKCKKFSLFVCYVFLSKKIIVIKYGHRHTSIMDPSQYVLLTSHRIRYN